MSQGCLSTFGAIAVLFEITENDNPFFDWLSQADEDKMIDLGMILTADVAMNNYITGYVGTDTIPPCTRFLCWYIIETPFKIS